MSVERYTGQLTWQPNAIAPGVYPVQITVSPIGAVDTKTNINFDVTVYRDQTPPRIAIGAIYPQQPVVGDTVKVFLSADDSDGDTVAFKYRIEHPLMIRRRLLTSRTGSGSCGRLRCRISSCACGGGTR